MATTIQQTSALPVFSITLLLDIVFLLSIFLRVADSFCLE